MKNTVANVRKQLLTKYPKPFVDMLARAGAIKAITVYSNDNALFTVSMMEGEIENAYTQYENIYSHLYEQCYIHP